MIVLIELGGSLKSKSISTIDFEEEDTQKKISQSRNLLPEELELLLHRLSDYSNVSGYSTSATVVDDDLHVVYSSDSKYIGIKVKFVLETKLIFS